MDSVLLRRYALYYAAIFLVPMILLGGFLYYVINGSLRAEVRQNVYEDLVLVGLSIDEQIDQMIATASTLQASSFFGRYAYDRDPNRSRELIGLLNVFVSLNPLIDSAIVYFEEQPFLFSETSTLTRNFLDRYVRLEGVENDSLLRVMMRTTDSRYIGPVVWRANEEELRDIALYIFPITRDAQRIGAGAFFISSDYLQQTIQNDEARQSTAYIVSDNSETILFEYVPEPSMRHDAELWEVAASGGSLGVPAGTPIRYRDSEYFVHQVTSPHGLVHASVTPARLANDPLRPVVAMLWATFAGLTVLGALTVTLFSRRTYEPIRRLRRISSTISGETGSEGEVALIEDTLSRLVAENATLSEKGTAFEQMNRRDFVFRLIKGMNVDDENLEKRGRDLAFLQPNHAYAAGIVSTRSPLSQLQRARLEQMEADANELVSASILVRETVETNALHILISAPVESPMKVVMDALLWLLRDRIGQVTLAVGSFSPEWRDLARSFVEAEISIQYSYVNDAGTLLYYPNIRQVKALDERYYSPSRLYALRDYVRQCDVEAFGSLLRDVRDDAASHPYHLSMVKALAFDLKNTFYLGLKDLERTQTVPESVYAELEALRDADTFAAFCDRLVDILNRVRVLLDRHQGGGSDAVHQYTCYLRRRYSDVNLSLESVAEEFEMSPAGFSRSFKKAIHMGFLECLTFIRIEEAKKKLKRPGFSVGEVARAVGYQNPGTFIRRFRQLEGITPGEYQKLIVHEQTGTDQSD